MTITDQVKQDVAVAMKARERDRVAALRLILSELQKDREGGDGRRGRRAAPRAQAPPRRRVGLPRRRPPRARRRRGGGGPRDRGLPARRSSPTRSCARSSRTRSTSRGATSPRDMGTVMKVAMGEVAGAPTASACPTHGPGGAGCVGRSSSRQRRRRELAGSGDSVLRALEGALDCDVFLRGNVITLDGDDAGGARPRRPWSRSSSELIERGHEIGPGDDRRRSPARSTSTTSPAEILDDVVWRHRVDARSRRRRSTRSATSTRSGARRSRSASARPAPARRSWRWRWPSRRSSRREVNRIILTRPAVEAGERLGLPARRHPWRRSTRTCARSSTRCYDMLDPERVSPYLERGHDRGRAAGVHAWPRAAARPAAVLTPGGCQADRELRVGDLVTGLDGQPTPVLGVYPAGRARRVPRNGAGRRIDALLRRAPVARFTTPERPASAASQGASRDDAR